MRRCPELKVTVIPFAILVCENPLTRVICVDPCAANIAPVTNMLDIEQNRRTRKYFSGEMIAVGDRAHAIKWRALAE